MLCEHAQALIVIVRIVTIIVVIATRPVMQFLAITLDSAQTAEISGKRHSTDARNEQIIFSVSPEKMFDPATSVEEDRFE